MIIGNAARMGAARQLISQFAAAGHPAAPAPAGGKPGPAPAGGRPDPQRSPVGWPITRAALVGELNDRLAGKSEPNQVQTSYCGPAAFLYCLLEDRPDLYVAYAIGLWQHGRFDFGTGASAMHLHGTKGMAKVMEGLEADRRKPGHAPVSDLDWMTMASLSASTRPFGRLQHSPLPTDQAGSISYPMVVKSWFAALGVQPWVSTMGLGIATSSLMEFLNLMRRWSSCWIVLQIDVSLLSGGKTSFFQGRHWIVVDPHRQPMVRDGAGKVVPIGETAADIWKVPLDVIESGQFVDGPLMNHWVTNLRLVSWGKENYAMARQELGHLVGRIYGGYAFPRFR